MIQITAPTTKHCANGESTVTLTVTISAREHRGPPLDAERSLQAALNELGQAVMSELLERYDTEGEPRTFGNLPHTSKGKTPATYHTLFGPVRLERHTYQSSLGGRTYCPLEQEARICHDATIALGAVIAAKHASVSGRELQRDLELSHQLHLSLSYLQDLSTELGQRALGKEEHWSYAPKTPVSQANAVVIYMDGTCGAICNEGYKQIMVGVVEIVDDQAQRLESIYIAQAPEEGKHTFYARMDRELNALPKRYGKLLRIGLCDGAPDLQQWLEDRSDYCTLDFYHVSEYVTKVAPIYARSAAEQKAWLQETLHELKHHERGAQRLLSKLRRAPPDANRSSEQSKALEDATRYVSNNLERMDYSLNRVLGVPIGSGVVEAACKHVVKHRAGGSGMRWKRKGLQAVLTLRSLYLSTGRWEQYWNKVQCLGW
jgi:hypothetical protein